MAYTEVVEQYDRDLTPSEERLYQEFIYNKPALAFMTAAEIAASVGVHESTVVRLAQKLGYKGYRDPRANLKRELINNLLPFGSEDVLHAFALHVRPLSLETLFRFSHSAAGTSIHISDNLGPLIRLKLAILIAARHSANTSCLL
jgi:DNA-binding MurR/RpiR family transcriptional regulator